MILRFLYGFLAIILSLFSCQQKQQTPLIDWENTVNNLITAIETRDIDALESMMCRNIKQNVEDLPVKIGELIDAIDGKITDFNWETFGGTTATALKKQS